MQICRLLLNARACILFFSMLCLASDVWSFGVYAQVCWGVVSPLDTVDRKVIDEQEIRGFFGGCPIRFFHNWLKPMGLFPKWTVRCLDHEFVSANVLFSLNLASRWSSV